MSEEMKEIIDDMIKQYEIQEVGRVLSEQERETFINAFLKGVSFSNNMSQYL